MHTLKPGNEIDFLVVANIKFDDEAKTPFWDKFSMSIIFFLAYFGFLMLCCGIIDRYKKYE